MLRHYHTFWRKMCRLLLRLRIVYLYEIDLAIEKDLGCTTSNSNERLFLLARAALEDCLSLLPVHNRQPGFPLFPN